MSFWLVPKSVTLNDVERRNGRYFALFQRIRVTSGAHCVKVHVGYLISWWVLVFFGIGQIGIQFWQKRQSVCWTWKFSLKGVILSQKRHFMGLCVTGLQLTVTFFAFHLLQEGKRRAHTESTFERLTVSALKALPEFAKWPLANALR